MSKNLKNIKMYYIYYIKIILLSIRIKKKILIKYYNHSNNIMIIKVYDNNFYLLKIYNCIQK